MIQKNKDLGFQVFNLFVCVKNINKEVPFAVKDGGYRLTQISSRLSVYTSLMSMTNIYLHFRVYKKRPTLLMGLEFSAWDHSLRNRSSALFPRSFLSNSRLKWPPPLHRAPLDNYCLCNGTCQLTGRCSKAPSCNSFEFLEASTLLSTVYSWITPTTGLVQVSQAASCLWLASC